MATPEELANLKAILLKLDSGQSVASIQNDGRRIEFHQADRAALRAQIAAMERSLGVMGGRRRPLSGVR